MKLFKKFFIVLSVLIFILTVSACTISENALEGFINQINSVSTIKSTTPSKSNFSSNKQTSSKSPISKDSKYVPTSEIPAVSTQTTPNSVKSDSKNFANSSSLDTFTSTTQNVSYELIFNYINSSDFFTLCPELIDKSSSGKIARDGWLSGFVFVDYKQSKKTSNPIFGINGIIFTINSPARVTVYATRGSTYSVDGDLAIINEKSEIISMINPTAELSCYEMTIYPPGTYQLCTASERSSINIFAVKVELY